MKWPKINHIIFGANLGLLVAVCFYFFTRTAPQPIQATEAAPEPTPLPTPGEKVVSQTVAVATPIAWRQLESENYREYIARLRSIGCPEQTIRDIIIADLDKLYAPRVQALQGRRKDLKYWNSEEEELANDVDPRARQQQQREIDKEKHDIIEQLLGIDLVRERLKQRGNEDYYERRLSFLPEQKRDAVRQVLEKYDQQELAIRNKELENGEPMTPADKAEIRRLQQERQAALAGTLSTTEATQMDLWLSPSANSVRHDMYGMNATEEEFQAIYQLRKGFDDKWNQVDPEMMPDSLRTQYAQAQTELQAQIKQTLGEQRYAEYQRGSDEDFHRLSATASRFNLPRQTVSQVYEMKQTLTSINERVRNDPNMTPEQKEKALKAVADETERQVKSLMGESAFRYYVWQGQGYWLTK